MSPLGQSYFLRMVFIPDSSSASAGAAAAATVESFHFFTRLGVAALPDAQPSIDAVEMAEEGGRQATVTVSADFTAVYVTLETRGRAFAGECLQCDLRLACHTYW